MPEKRVYGISSVQVCTMSLKGSYLRSTVSRDIVAARHHNETHNGNQYHDGDSQRSVPQVEHLCDWHHASSA